MGIISAPYSVVTSAATVYPKVSIEGGDVLLMSGDSTDNSTPVTGLYAWWDTVFKDSVNAAVLPGAVTWVNAGVNGDTIAGVKARMTSELVSSGATCGFLSIGSNNVFNGTSPAAYRADMDDTLDQVLDFGIPADKYGLCGVYFRGSEAWGTGPAWDNPTFNALTVALNAEGQASAEERGIRWIGWREQLLYRAVDLNRSKATTGVLSLDGTHFITLGKAQAAAIVLADYATVTP